jgi:organic radical activating enzyme
MEPHPDNFCGGNFPDWLEVMLTSACNGSCSWCVEKQGYHPKETVSWTQLARKILSTDKQNIILLGGEPTLYSALKHLIELLWNKGRNIYVTTNGSRLTPDYALFNNLTRLTGINISIHHYSLAQNNAITGVNLNREILKDAIRQIKMFDTKVRLNCNVIKDHIDRESALLEYIRFAKDIGADSIRFAELKIEEDNFVSLAQILKGRYHLNEDPFQLGCNKNTVIHGMPVNFRQMCGLQTSKRPRPTNPEFKHQKQVLYYDGILYNGWQERKDKDMTLKGLKALLEEVAAGNIPPADAAKLLHKTQLEENKATQAKAEAEAAIEGHCAY